MAALFRRLVHFNLYIWTVVWNATRRLFYSAMDAIDLSSDSVLDAVLSMHSIVFVCPTMDLRRRLSTFLSRFLAFAPVLRRPSALPFYCPGA